MSQPAPVPSSIAGPVRQGVEAVQQAIPPWFCRLLRWIVDNDYVVAAVALVAMVVLVFVAVWLSGRKAGKNKDGAPRSPLLLLSWEILLGIYVGARLIDLVFAIVGVQAPYLSAEELRHTGQIETWLLGGSWTWPLLPLAHRPAVAVLLHCVLWTALLFGVYRAAIAVTGIDAIRASNEPAITPGWFRWTGCSTTQGLDLSVKAWVRPLTIVLGVAVALGAVAVFQHPSASQTAARCGGGPIAAIVDAAASGLTDVSAVQGPPAVLLAPGLFVLLFLFIPVMIAHLRQYRVVAEKPQETKEAPAKPEPVDPLQELRTALESVLPGASIAEEVGEIEPSGGQDGQWPEGIPSAMPDTFHRAWQIDNPYATQAQVLELIHRTMRLSALEADRSRDLSSAVKRASAGAELPQAEAIVLCGAEGTGRCTTLLASAALAYLERGGGTLLVCRDMQRVERIAQRMRETLESSSIRWSVQVAVAGKDLIDVLAARRLPALVITDLACLDRELLLDQRADGFLSALDLVLVDELHEYIGAAEMHLSLMLRRLWLTLQHLDRGRDLPLTLATSTPLFTDAAVWATGVLGRLSAAVALRGPAARGRAVVKRVHLRGPEGKEVNLTTLARACEQAGLPWLLRMSGDGKRSIQRADGELRALSQHRVSGPRKAAVVLLEGTFGEVTRELDVTGLVGLDTDYERGVQVAAPPVEEETALAPMGDRLPWRATAVVPPDALRLAHALRATHARPLSDTALRDRILAGTLQAHLDAWIRQGVLESRPRRYLPAYSVQPAVERMLVRSATASPLADIDMACVTDRVARLIDGSTGTSLRRIDASSAPGTFYPGAVVLLQEGRFRLPNKPDKWRIDGSTYAAFLLEAAMRSIAEGQWSPAEGCLWKLASTDRAMGKRTLRCRSGEITLEQRLQAVRLYGPDRELVEVRTLNPTVDASLTTQALLIASGAKLEAMIPVAAALSMAIPSIVRCADALLQVALVEAGNDVYLAFYDTTEGGNGMAAAVDESQLGILLQMAGAVLRQLSDALLERVKASHDRAPGAGSRTWDLEGARAWIGDVVDVPEPGTRTPPELPVADLARLAMVKRVFPALDWFPPEEASLFLEWVAGVLSSVPMRSMYGARPTDDDRLCVAAGLASVFYRRPDMHLPDGFFVQFEPGKECHEMPGAAGYCVSGSEFRIAVALEPLRASIPLDNFALVPHEAGHLFDALDGVSDGLLSGMSDADRARWLKAMAAEIPAAARGQSVLPQYAATHPREFMAESVAAFVEIPTQLRAALPVIYGALRTALRQDPAVWADDKSRAGV